MNQSIFLGLQYGYAASTHPYNLPFEHLQRHCHILGKTGMGKTTLLKAFALPLIHADEGFGVVDVHGDFAEDILRSVPNHRLCDVVYLNFGDTGFAPTLNLVASSIPIESRPAVATSLLSAFRHIWSDSWGPRLEYILYHALRVLLDAENTSLVCLPRLLTDPHYRSSQVKQCLDPFIRYFWESEFESWDHRYRREAISPVLNKLGQFVSNPFLREVFGQIKLKVNFREVMDSRKILIVNLSKGKIGEDASRLAGALLVAFLSTQAMTRVDCPSIDRIPFTLIVDEAQNFLSDALSVILSESRKFGLGIVLAHQYLNQLSPDLQSAVLGNVGTLISMRVAGDDGNRMVLNFGNHFKSSEFVDLAPYTAFVRPISETCIPFRMRVIPPDESDFMNTEAIVANSRDRFASSRNAVREKLERWMSS